MDCYFCIVNLPGKMGADVCVLAAEDDNAAMAAMTAQARLWVGYETVFLYFGERFVGSLVDGTKGFPSASRCDGAPVRPLPFQATRTGERPRRPVLRPDARRTG